MRTFIFILTFLNLNILSMSAQEETGFTLTIEFSITKYNKGNILLALYDSNENYLKNAVRSSKVEVKDKKAVIRFDNLEKGVYGFSFFHDVDNNGKLNKNFMGIPKEPYGFSNNEKGKFGPPDFEKIRFPFQDHLKLEVSIK